MVNFANCRIFRPCFPPKSAKKRRSITHSNWPFVFSKVLKKSNQNRSPYFSRKKRNIHFCQIFDWKRSSFFFLAITIVQTTNYFHKSRPLLSVYYLLLIMQENVIFCCQNDFFFVKMIFAIFLSTRLLARSISLLYMAHLPTT